MSKHLSFIALFLFTALCSYGLAQYAPYPGGLAPTGPMATPTQCTVAGTTGAVTCTLSAAVGKVTYICGFAVSSTGGTATSGPVTINTIQGGTWTYQLSANVAGQATNFSQTFAPCLQGNGTNSAISIATTANGTATAVDVVASGFQL